MTARARCLLEHPHPGQQCRDPRTVYRNRWGVAKALPPVEVLDGQLALEVPPATSGAAS